MSNKHKGSAFDSFLEEEKLLAEVEAVAVKRVIAHEIEKAMKRKHLNKTKMANKMETSRSELDRVLDPENTSITLRSLSKVAHALGKKLVISYV